MKKGLIFATTLAMALGVGVAVGAHRSEAKVAKAYGNDDAYWYVAGTFNSWTLQDDDTHLTYSKMAGNNWEYESDEYIEFKENDEFKFVYSWGGTPETTNYLTPALMTNSTDFTGGNGSNFVASRDIKVKFFLQIYGSEGSWMGVYWEEYEEPAVDSKFYYSLNGATAVEMSKGSGSEYVSAELDFAKGDVVSFRKDDDTYAVEPKDSGQQTKVYAVSGGLKFAEAFHGALYLDTNDAVLWAGQFTPGYYLASSKTGWEPKLGTPAELETGENPAWKVENLELNANEGVKIVNFPEEGNTVTWYDVTYESEQPRVHTSSEVQFSVDGDRNLVVANAGTYNVYYNTTSGWYSIEDVNYTPDVPASDGYYLISSLTDFKYAGATPMPSVDPSTGNVAVLVGYDPEPGEKVKVRSYFSGEDKYSANVDVDKDYGEVDEEFNFVFADDIGEDDTFDIYAFYDGSSFLFSVAPHAERYQVTVVAKQFAGAQYQGETSALARDEVIEGHTYEVTAAIPSGYVALGVYSDFACTVPFISGETVITSDLMLHIKCMQLGYYLAGGEDSTFSIENATKLSSTVSDKIVGAVTVPAGTDAEHPFIVKPLEYVADRGDGQPGWAPATYTAGDGKSYAFVSINAENSNFEFVEPGTYAFYVNNGNEVWFNSGEYAFHEDFLSRTAAQCDGEEGKHSNLEALKLAWVDFAEAFDDLSPEEKAAIIAVGMEHGDEKSTDARLRMIARYAYIVTKYGTEMFEDFIWNQTYEPRVPSTALNGNYLFEGNLAIVIVISIAATSTLAFTLLLVFKKKKQK